MYSFFFFLGSFPWQETYRQKLQDTLALDSEGKPFRMLVFSGSPKSSRRSIRCVDEMRRNDEAEEFGDNMKGYCQLRTMPKVGAQIRHQILFCSFYVFSTLI